MQHKTSCQTIPDRWPPIDVNCRAVGGRGRTGSFRAVRRKELTFVQVSAKALKTYLRPFRALCPPPSFSFRSWNA